MKVALFARAVIMDRGRILVNRTPEDVRFFGGRVKPREKTEKALRRELAEELSLPVDILAPIFVEDDFRKGRSTTIYFEARILSAMPQGVRALEPHLNPMWLTEDDLAFDLIPKKLRTIIISRFDATVARSIRFRS